MESQRGGTCFFGKAICRNLVTKLKFNLFSNGIHLSVLVFYQKYVGSFAGAGVILKMSRGIFKYTRLP